MLARSMMRVGLRIAIAIALATSCRSGAFAAGCFVTRPGEEALHVWGMRAAVVFDSGLEELLLEVDFLDAPPEFGWIVPVPAEPEILATRGHVFAGFDEWEPGFARSSRTAQVGALIDCSSFSFAAGADVVDGAVIPPSDREALTRWLDEHQFSMSEGAKALTSQYSERGWFLAALRVRTNEVSGVPIRSPQDTLTSRGTTQVVRLLFKTLEPVYPLGICAALSRPVDLTLCVVSNGARIAAGLPQEWPSHPMQAGGPSFGSSKEQHFPGLQSDEARVTRLKKFVNPNEAIDLEFRLYDPIEVLKLDDEQLRAEAVSEIGRQRRVDLVEHVVDALDSCEPRAPLAVAALWALGELGGERAEDELLDWAASPVIECRFEALESLARLRCHEALERYLEIVRHPAESRNQIDWVGSERRACWEHLIAFGDSTCIPSLKEMVAPFPGLAWAWASFEPDDDALNAYAALAACGDSGSFETLRDYLLIDGENTVPDKTLAKSMGGSVNYFPRGFSLGLCVLSGGFCSDHFRSAALLRLLAARPQFRDAVLRSAALDSRMPDGGKLYLLSKLDTATDADVELLLDIARRAIGSDAVHVDCAVHQSRGIPDARIRYNVYACSAAYALAEIESLQGLLRLWEMCPPEDHVVRAEIAYSLAMLGAPEGFEPVLKHIETAWSAKVSSPAYRDAMVARITPDGLGHPGVNFDDLDVQYRQRKIVRFLRNQASNRDVTLRLINSQRLHPLLRLQWVKESIRMLPLWPEFRDHALGVVSAIERENTDPLIAALAATVRADVDRVSAVKPPRERRLH